ncbi:MAG: hypothetical protein DI587_14510 [Variovorax paradoxus]|nr:MAG: hypothetical protein DI583_14510 [Variovorax paradoxus]PZQ09626.1 MAG: hypothetical protein DI587_14510 [Variovorax paradoxus]
MPTTQSESTSKNVNAVAPKAEALAKVLQHGQETLEGLTRITGWGEKETQRTLLALIAGGRAKCININGRRMFVARALV